MTANMASMGPSPVAASVISSPLESTRVTVAVGLPLVPATTWKLLSLKSCSAFSELVFDKGFEVFVVDFLLLVAEGFELGEGGVEFFFEHAVAEFVEARF